MARAHPGGVAWTQRDSQAARVSGLRTAAFAIAFGAACCVGALRGVNRAAAQDAGLTSASEQAGASEQPVVPASLVALVRAAKHEEALAALAALPEAQRASSPLRYLRGRLLERLGRAGEAADALATLGGLPDAVAKDAARRRAVLLAQAGNCADARPLLAALPSPTVAVHVQRAVCARAAGDRAAAITAQRAAARAAGERAFAEHFQLAALLADAAQRAEAARVLRALVVARPDHPKESLARARLAALEGTGTTARLDAAERVARAEQFSRAHQHERALAELEGVRVRGGRGAAARGLRARLLHVRGMALYGTRARYPEAARVLAQAAALGGATATTDAFHAARALARSDDDAGAIRAYSQLVRAHPDAPEAPEAEYLAGLLALRSGARDGVARLERFVRGPRAVRAPDEVRAARAELAFAQFDAGRFAEARAAFAAYAASGTGGLVRGRGLYWAGRAAERANDPTAAVAHYRAALAAEALHWYALLARARLEALGKDVGPPVPASPSPNIPSAAAPLALPPAPALYLALGLDDDALALVRRDEDALRRAAPAGRELEALSALYLRLGDAARAHRLVAQRAVLTLAPDADDAWLWAAAYPRPWAESVAAAERAETLPDDYLYAIMRQESGYDPDAVSYADAIGLLQMLPSTGRRIAERIGLAPFDRARLFEPETNIRLSAAYHASLLRAFGEQWPLAIAAYNAGGPRVRRWLRTIPDDDLARFVERIPVDQTRNYVRRVITHLARYRYLSDPARGWPFALPATLDRTRVGEER
jgi:soluble lytic murein transglycosylase